MKQLIPARALLSLYIMRTPTLLSLYIMCTPTLLSLYIMRTPTLLLSYSPDMDPLLRVGVGP